MTVIYRNPHTTNTLDHQNSLILCKIHKIPLQRYYFFLIYANNQQFSYQNFNNPLLEQVFYRAYAIYLVSLQSERLLSEAMRKQTLPMNGVQRRG